MNIYRKSIYFALFCAVLVLIWPALVSIWKNTATPSPAHAQTQCSILTSPEAIPAPALINFDDLPNAATIADHYQPSFGVRFEDNELTRAIIYGNEPSEAASPPNVAANSAVPPNTSDDVPMDIWFDQPKTHVGMYIGNGETQQITADLTAYNAAGGFICSVRYPNVVPEPHTGFLGIYDPDGTIMHVTLDYGGTTLSESIDDLYFSPRAGIPPTRTPNPTWTPVPSATPTQGPTPTATPLIPMIPYIPPVIILPPPLLTYDLSLHGIEITQGIQCFNTSQGLASCPNNSLPMVAKKDTAARTYIKIGGTISSMNNVPIRLYIRANNVWYQANANGKATTAINQANADSANIYFNVNFTNDVVVDFYAVVDPDNLYPETNETNNRFPSVGYITLTFYRRGTLDIVGQRLYYHPSGYSGDQYAGGWAVNGGAADWFEQMLPIRNNGIDYSVKSGYLNWTSNLGDSDNQHALIQTLNFNWLLENAFAWWFGTGAFTGAEHVYGWAPNDGYSGGHADMPVYPHAGGLGVVGIGTDRPGTNTDNPGGGALIFGHELVHDYNVYHTNTADACGSSDDNSDFPYASSSIQEFGFNPYTGKIYTPSTTHDLMSYCPAGGSKQGWIAPFTWNRMFNELDPTGLAIYQQSERWGRYFALMPNGADESLVVNATIYNPSTIPTIPGKLNDLYQIDAGVSYTPLPGDYAVELWNVDGTTIYSQTFEVNFESEYDAHTGGPFAPTDDPPFPPEPTGQVDVSFIIPLLPGTVQVVLTHQGTVLDARAVSANPPQVLITSPTEEESWLPGSTHTLTWQGLDLDGDALTYTLLYSNDGGTTWVLLDGGFTETSYEVQTDSLAGGSDVRFRVVATDGVNTALDETDAAITVPNQAPQATILNPAPNGYYSPGHLIVLQGYGTDMEDGSLPEEALSWSSDVNGGLGIGPSLPITTLTPGTHVITLTVTDSYGISSSVSVTINIAYPMYLPLIVR
ncbi:MAG: hypothetical protein Fur0022_18490 [Anaerolineales bacterium]